MKGLGQGAQSAVLGVLNRSKLGNGQAGQPAGSEAPAAAATGTPPTWVRRGPRQAGARALLAAAVSDDGRYLAVGGGDWRVHVWDVRAGGRPAYVQVGRAKA